MPAGALVDRDVGRQRLAGCTFAQHTMATCAALEVDLTRLVEFRLRHGRRLGVGILMHQRFADGGGAGLQIDFSLRKDGVFFLLRQGSHGDGGKHQRGYGRHRADFHARSSLVPR